MDQPVISALQSFIMGIVEGITEYLPVSSTGHLVVTSHLLGLDNELNRTADQIAAIKAFEIVIQSGAILAVIALYQKAVREMIAGIMGKSEDGRRLFINVCCAALPILCVGFLVKNIVERYQSAGPVLTAMIIGGIAMIVFERFFVKESPDRPGIQLNEITPKQAVFIGCFQCLALWPGTSRSMTTILSGMVAGLKRSVAAEFSFLVGLPVLLIATVYKGAKSGPLLLEHIGSVSLAIGLLTSAVFAFIAVKWLVAFLNRRGLEVFGWYRLVFAAVIYFVIGL